MNEVGFLSHTIYKYQLRINYGPKHKCKTLRKKKYENLCSVRFSKNFFNMALKTQVTKVKIDKFEYITSWQIDGETVETVADFIFWRAPKPLQMVTTAMKLKDAYSLEGKL